MTAALIVSADFDTSRPLTLGNLEGILLLYSKQLRDHLDQAQDLDSIADVELKCHLIAELMFVLGIGERQVSNFDDALHQIALKVAALQAEESAMRRNRPRPNHHGRGTFVACAARRPA